MIISENKFVKSSHSILGLLLVHKNTVKMHFYIENLKISNFLSFFGEYEVDLMPFTGIICNYDQGKVDFMEALNFVFGALSTDNLIDFVHNALREEFLVNRNIRTYVEVTVRQTDENKRTSFRKTIKNGRTVLRLEHKISGIITSRCLYEEKLNSLNLDIKQKHLIFSKSDFDACIWGTSEDLEKTIINCLREEYLLDEWKRVRKESEYWLKINDRLNERNYQEVSNTHQLVTKFANRFKTILENRLTSARDLITSFEEIDWSPLAASSDSNSQSDVEDTEIDKSVAIFDLEMKRANLSNELINLKFKAAILTSQIYYYEIRLAEKQNNFKLLQDRIKKLKHEIHKKEDELVSAWKSFLELSSQIDCVSRDISKISNLLNENHITDLLQLRFTLYGRFSDYIQPSQYYTLLRKILGDELFFAHLCDTMDDAARTIDLLKTLKYETREMFIVFENYSYHLKDLLIASGERGIEIRQLEDLLRFVSKLVHYGLIEDIPVFVKKNFEDAIPPTNAYVIFLVNDLHFTKCGLISYKFTENAFNMESRRELERKLIKLTNDEERKFQKLHSIIFKRFEIRSDMNEMENDIDNMKRVLKKSKSVSLEETQSFSDVQSVSVDLFFEREETQGNERQTERQETHELTQREAEVETNALLATSLVKDLEEVLANIEETKSELERCAEELRFLDVKQVYIKRPREYYVGKNDVDISKFFFAKELRKLRNLAIHDDIEEFLVCQDWRTSVVKSLNRESREVKKKIKDFNESSKCLRDTRKRQLIPFIEHCRQHLPSTFKCLIGNALPSIDLRLTPEEFLQLSSSFEENYINLVDIKHFNTFLKFISVLSLFLELCMFDKIPLIILDNIEQYFPMENDTLEAVFEPTVMEKLLPGCKNPSFSLLMRIGQYLSNYVEKNISSTSLLNKKNPDELEGPMQIIFFGAGDFIHSAKHYIWIHQNLSPEVCTGEDSDVYSQIHEININGLI